MDIQTREQDNGIVNVYVGSEPLVDFNRSRGLKTQTVLEDGIKRVTVRFADNGGVGRDAFGQTRRDRPDPRRDTWLANWTRLDQLAAGLIYEVNCAHTGGPRTGGLHATDRHERRG